MGGYLIRAIARRICHPDPALAGTDVINIIVSGAGAGDDPAALKVRHSVVGHQVHFGNDRVCFSIQGSLLLSMKADDALYLHIEASERVQSFRRIAGIDAGNDNIPGHNVFSSSDLTSQNIRFLKQINEFLIQILSPFEPKDVAIITKDAHFQLMNMRVRGLSP
jgi:hypothetical protein